MRLSKFQRLVRPSAWPIAGKLAFAFVVAALIPIFLTAIYGSRETIAAVTANEERGLSQLTQNTAARIDQLLDATSKSLRLLQRLDEMRAVASRPTAQSKARANQVAIDFVGSNHDVELALILDLNGKVIAASSPRYFGADLAWRGYFKKAASGQDYISSLQIGTISGRAGVYFSSPIRDPNGAVLGVVALKLTDGAVQFIIGSSQLRETLTPFLLDEFGVVIAHKDESKRFKSLAPISAAAQVQISEDQRYGRSSVESLGLTALANAMVNAKRSGSVSYIDDAGAEQFVAYAPLTSNGWVYGVSEAKDVWSRPLRAAFMQALYKALLVALVAALIALAIFVRDIIRPVRALTRSARAVRRGELVTAEAAVINDDEIGYLAKSFNRMIESIIQRERERDIFGRMVTPEVRERLLGGQIKLGGENRYVSVLFSDIRDFTSLCEGQSPEAVVELINEYLTEMTAAVAPHKGYVNNFLGDAIIVVFGAPQDHARPAHAATLAAFDMRDRLAALNTRRRGRGVSELRSGIGVASGVVVAGQMGSLDRFVYTVIGDAVNVASRLETLTKEFAANPILMNAETADAVRAYDDIALEYVGARQLKGRTEAVEVFRVDRRASRPPADLHPSPPPHSAEGFQ